MTYFPQTQLRWLLLVLIVLSAQLKANECAVESEICIASDSWQASIALGGGALSNPVNGGGNIPLLILPSVSYYGEQFYLENTEIGYTLSENSKYAFSLTAGLNSEAAYFYRWHPSNIVAPSNYSGGGAPINTDTVNTPSSPKGSSDGSLTVEGEGSDGEYATIELPDPEIAPEPAQTPIPIPKVSINDVQKRKWAADGGARLHLFTDWGVVQLHAVSDISHIHNGYQLSANFQHAFVAQDWLHVLTLGGSYKSENLVDYYYGIDAQDHEDPRVYYQGKGSFNPYLRWFGDHKLTNDWHFIYWLGVEHLGEGISNSPLVNKSTVGNAFIGFSYRLL